MPELPEVETIAKDLHRKVKGQVIVGFWTDWPKAVKLPSVPVLKKRIKGLRILKVGRVGKNVLFHLSEGKMLLVHQKMTGHLMVGRWRIKGKVEAISKGPLQEKVNQFIHTIFYLKNRDMIALSDMRKFAKIVFGDEAEILNLPEITKLGPDALDSKFSVREFGKRVSSRRKAIKATLMDPAVVAGIGNIYADDILWSAKVHPLTPANKLSPKSLNEIFKHTREILKRAVKLRGTSVGDYRDTSGKKGRYGSEVLVYRKTGRPCPRCGTAIERTKVGQRSAHFCPRCQKL
ncbi:MAG: bifunctional DNA-formamidopyrimidine glycosylase/DNA-(apurinic or apyrimidinic site) lyase [bacterium]|nr:bifunctional DNA-formamidopyrimidine glycosylase/DNA-(apurinic or apyrimidinic site) lyase [bacterium]